MFLNVLQNVRQQYYAKVIIKLESSNGNYDLELINKTMYTCDFFNNPKYEPIAQVFYRALTKSGTFVNRCPITKVYEFDYYHFSSQLTQFVLRRNYTLSKIL